MFGNTLRSSMLNIIIYLVKHEVKQAQSIFSIKCQSKALSSSKDMGQMVELLKGCKRVWVHDYERVRVKG